MEFNILISVPNLDSCLYTFILINITGHMFNLEGLLLLSLCKGNSSTNLFNLHTKPFLLSLFLLPHSYFGLHHSLLGLLHQVENHFLCLHIFHLNHCQLFPALSEFECKTNKNTRENPNKSCFL